MRPNGISIEAALKADMRLGECLTCDTGEPVRLFLDVERGDAVNCCETCCAKWAADIIRGLTTDAAPAAKEAVPSVHEPIARKAQ